MKTRALRFRQTSRRGDEAPTGATRCCLRLRHPKSKLQQSPQARPLRPSRRCCASNVASYPPGTEAKSRLLEDCLHKLPQSCVKLRRFQEGCVISLESATNPRQAASSLATLRHIGRGCVISDDVASRLQKMLQPAWILTQPARRCVILREVCVISGGVASSPATLQRRHGTLQHLHGGCVISVGAASILLGLRQSLAERGAARRADVPGGAGGVESIKAFQRIMTSAGTESVPRAWKCLSCPVECSRPGFLYGWIYADPLAESMS